MYAATRALTPRRRSASRCGDSVWVYNRYGDGLTEIDPDARTVRRTMKLVADPVFVNVPQGPVLAADAHGAWLVGVDRNDVGFLTEVRTGVPGQRLLRLDFEPWGVAVGKNAVWVVGEKGSRGELVRVDPRRRVITARKLLPRPVVLDSVTAGFGAAFAVDAARALLYRIDPRRLDLSPPVRLGPRPGRPWTAFGHIWVSFNAEGTQGYLVNPTYLTVDLQLSCCPPRQGADTAGFGSTWTVNWPSGTVVRWDGLTKEPVGDIHVTGAPQFGAPCMTSIAAGAGAVWVTVAPTSEFLCAA
jgi:hypothetical protein